METVKKSIGFVAVRKGGKTFGGYRARCRVYDGPRRALSCQRAYIRDADGWRWQTDEEVLARWDIVEAFIEVPCPPR